MYTYRTKDIHLFLFRTFSGSSVSTALIRLDKYIFQYSFDDFVRLIILQQLFKSSPFYYLIVAFIYLCEMIIEMKLLSKSN